ncbi:MAG: redoxin domain-containing protein [Gemmataceae bacterium]|nr:redoxin domain-containing protein [Gemmataceae bacterium]
MLLLVAAAAAAVEFAAPRKTPGRVWSPPRPATAAEPLAAGTPAPDFALTPVDGGPPVRLADLLARGRPVVLIFTSFTCDCFHYHQPGLRELYRSYRDRAEFLTVVVREGEHELPGVGFLLAPPDGADRCELVGQAVEVRGWTVPTVVDGPDAAAEEAYRAYPFRVVGVEPDGRVAFASQFTGGLFGLDVRALARWLEDRAGPPAAGVGGVG